MRGLQIGNSAGFRMAIIAGLTLLLMIPAGMIRSLITEREQTRDGAVAEISGKWGRCQTVAGPVLTVPYRRYEKDDKGKVVSSSVELAHFLPETLSVTGTMNPQVRYRGIYEAVLYNGKFHISGTFSKPDLRGLGLAPENMQWDEAYLALGISDMKGIKETIKVDWNGALISANPGIASTEVFSSGISARVGLDSKTAAIPFSLDVDLNGSRELTFLPVGKETKVALSSKWSSPSFQGEFLPEKRSITKDGFAAEWKVLSMNRNYPQQWTGKNEKPAASAFGVSLLLPLDEYQKTMRTTKYALMFIGLTFASFFVIEILGNRAIHPIQYLLVGTALVLFYTLLLSLTEHLRFQYSYLIAGAGIVTLVSAYSWSVLASRLFAGVIATVVSVLYGFLYVLLQCEDYALLLGSIGLFGILGLFMYLTRKVDWFTVLKPAVEQ
jgi:inner membrane protein